MKNPKSDHHSQHEPKLKITETFFSIQGEGIHAGLPCSFIRLTGCPLRCTYCDTAYAFHGGKWRTFEELIHELSLKPTNLVQITGGEPLSQQAVIPFIHECCERKYRILLETSGAVSIEGLHPSCHIVMDIKTPGSGEEHRNLWENISLLKKSDEIKFVLTSMEDWHWTQATIVERQLEKVCHILVSTVPEPHILKQQIVEAMLESGLNLRFQTQLHKIIWGEVSGK